MALPGYEDIPELSVRCLQYLPSFIEYLRTHTDGANPMTAKELAPIWRIRPPQIAAMRRAAWKNGEHICTDGRGYWYARDVREMNIPLAHVRARKRAEAINERRIIRILKESGALPQLELF